MSIYEVARIAGVSKSTVSRVINNAENVSPATADAVRRAMGELGYAPSPRRPGPRPRARPLGRRSVAFRHGSIALVNVGRAAELLSHPYFVRLQTGIRGRMAEMGVSLMLDAVTAAELPLCVREDRVDGVILTGQSPRRDVIERLAGFPAVWLGGGAHHPATIDHVLADNDAIGILAADYLARAGCARIASVNADPAGNSSATRIRGFRQRIAELGIDAEHAETDHTEPGPDDWDNIVLRERLAVLLDRLFARRRPRADAPHAQRPDGLFVPYDQHAMVAAQILVQMGLRAGGPGRETDILLVSVGNEDVYLDAISPRPATIEPDPPLMGRWAADRLLERISGGREGPVRIMAQPRIRPA